MTMRFIGTRSLSQNVIDWLTNTLQPRILHVFGRSCNLINEYREVVCVVTPQIGNGPLNLVIDDVGLFFDQINIKSRVSNSPRQLTIGNITFDTANAKLWNSRPNWEFLHSRRVEILRQLAKLETANPGDYQSSVFDLSTALACNDFSAVAAQSAQLAGLGIGLTPSGDDFIIGALYATWIIHAHETAENLAREVAAVAAPRTTSLSSAWLRSAGRGEAGHPWHEFLEALTSFDVGPTKAAMDRIKAIGATSGTDALAGFISTYISFAESEKKHVLPEFIQR